MNIINSQLMPPALTSGTRGMASASYRMEEAAVKIARAGSELSSVPGSSRELNQNLIEMKREQLLFNASARVVRTADNMIGSLLNIRA